MMTRVTSADNALLSEDVCLRFSKLEPEMPKLYDTHILSLDKSHVSADSYKDYIYIDCN